MKRPSRITLFVAGLMVLYICFLWPLLKVAGSLFISLPPISYHGGLIPLLYAHALVHFLGATVRSVLIGNLVMMAMTSFFLFRIGWLLCRGRRRLFGACASLVFFILSPSALSSLPRLACSTFWGVLLMLMLTLWFWLSIENWSTFMKSLVLAQAWAIFLWLNIPLACALAVVMVPWIIFSRRPLSSLGIGVMMISLGSVLFSFSWLVACGLTHHWVLRGLPLQEAMAVFHRTAESVFILMRTNRSWWLALVRIVDYAAIVSPFWFAAGMWHLIARARKVVAECRAKTVDYMAILSVVLLCSDIFLPASVSQIPLRYPLWVLALWAPLLGRELARLPKFYGQGVPRIDQFKMILAGSALVYFLARDWMLFRS